MRTHPAASRHPRLSPPRPALSLVSSIGPFLAAGLLASGCLTPPPKTVDTGVTAPETTTEPVVTYTGPTEAYTWKNVVIGGGGFVTGLAFSPVQAGILYARTDVGGAYRYDTANKSWIPLTDFISHKDANYMGIESLAVDPKNPDRVFMAVGMYTANWAGTGAFMRSDDRGATFKTFPVHFKMGGNDLSRSDGERLAVDPHQPNILFFGSRRDGLWKSTDAAETWSKVEGFPVADDTDRGLGLPIVLFDSKSGTVGKETPTIYVGTQTDGKFYRSSDAGRTWQKLPNQPELDYPPRRAVLDQDGTLYATYASGDSPYALSKGAVFKFEPKSGAFTDITPLRQSEGDTFGYGGIDVDASKPGTLIVATMDRWSKGAEIFRTQDGGKSWKPLVATATFDGGGVQHVYHHRETVNAPQWLGDIKIDPFDPNRAMLIEGGGVWATFNLTEADRGKPTQWSFHSNNLEELVARDLISPPEGPPLVSVMLDACGMRHDELDKSPSRGTFRNPTCASSEDIDYAGKKPNMMVRICNYPWDGTKGPRGAISTDSGASWKQFASEPEGCGGMGTVAITADGSALVWAPRDAKPAWSRDGGRTWTTVVGLPEPAKVPDWANWFLRLASDPVNPKKLYAFNALTGDVYLSVDGGAHFKVSGDMLDALPDYELHYASIKTVFGREGEVWVTTKKGLARSSDSGKTFDEIEGLEEAHGVGFGKAAPGKDFPAIYLSGKISGQTGFFRSDDAGASFVRINDDQHQYGGATVVTGDPRVYGRVYIAAHGRGIVYGEPKK